MTLDAFVQNIEITAVDDKHFSASLQIPADLSVLDGHFPGNPILPGVAYIFTAERLASRFIGIPLKLRQLKRTKFFAPTKPGDVLDITGDVAADASGENKWNVQVTFTHGQDQRISLVKMIMEK